MREVVLKRVFLCFLSCAMLLSSVSVYSQKKSTSKQKRAGKVSRTGKVGKGSSSRADKGEKNSSTSDSGKDTKNSKPLTCAEKYEICMDRACSDSETGMRYYCSTTIDSFETVVRDGETFRIGNDLYTFAQGLCDEVLRTCDLKERNHVQTVYKAKIQDDLLTKNYADAVKAGSDETQRELLTEYFACMQPLCGNNFQDCLTIKNVERRSPSCEGILAKSSKPLSVKKMFYDSLFDYRKKVCENTSGYIDYETKVCKVKVSFGSVEMIKRPDGQEEPTGKMAKEVASRTFNVGETVECTQEYFSTSNVLRPGLLSGLKDFAMGAVRSVAGVACIVAGAFGGGPGMIANGAGLVCQGIGSSLNGAVKVSTTVKDPKSCCFIDGNYVAGKDEFFRINFTN